MFAFLLLSAKDNPFRVLTRVNILHFVHLPLRILVNAGNTEKGNITVPLTSCLTGLDQSVLQIKTKNCQFSYNSFQTSQTGGQQYSDTPPFSIPWLTIFKSCFYFFRKK